MPQLEMLCTLPESSDTTPAIASHGGRLFIAWKGCGNPQLNVGVLDRDLRGLAGMEITPEATSHAPAMVSFADRLWVAWKGDGNEHLNTAQVEWFANTQGGAGIQGLSEKAVLPDTSEAGPAMAVDGSLLLGWRGAGNDNLNVGSGGPGDVDPTTLSDSSDVNPALAAANGAIYVAWKGAGNDQLNARAQTGGARDLAQAHTQIFDDASSHAPALAAHGGRVYMAWKGSGNEHLNLGVLEVEESGYGIAVHGIGAKQTFDDTTEAGPSLASHEGALLIAWKGAGNDNLNVARVPV